MEVGNFARTEIGGIKEKSARQAKALRVIPRVYISPQLSCGLLRVWLGVPHF